MEKRKKKVRVGGALSRMPTEHPGRLAVTSQSLAGYVANRCKKPHRHPPRTMGTMGAMAAWEPCPSSASRSREQRTDAAQRRGCRRMLFWAGTPICWIARRALLRWATGEAAARPQISRPPWCSCRSPVRAQPANPQRRNPRWTRPQTSHPCSAAGLAVSGRPNVILGSLPLHQTSSGQ